ncbi:unnamed protein product [Leptidea sinapis]|uniref:Uncharacterized protein n=1 Tax=Leptidea sinapis TaxID=189913 RepID=A0A5E4QTP9_9NEOP|nr:unnamed protein product [Leptidea sinapis]
MENIKKSNEAILKVYCDITKKNLYLKSTQNQNRKHIAPSTLIEIEVKRALGMISQEMQPGLLSQELISRDNKEYSLMHGLEEMKEHIIVCLNELSCAAVLKSELKKIKLSLTQVNPECISEEIASRYSNDELKVTFLKLKRVSDHTVFVKWHIPKALSEVRGYEVGSCRKYRIHFGMWRW